MNKPSKSLVHSNFIDTFERNWDRTFLVDGKSGISLTFGEFFTLAKQGAERLTELFPEKDKVCIVLPNSIELSILYFSILFANKLAVPVDPQKPTEEVLRVILSAETEIVITKNIDLPATNHVPSVNPERLMDVKQDFSNPPDEQSFEFIGNLDWEKVFLITYTSGSSGKPKGVMHSFSNLWKSATAFKNAHGMGAKNVFFHNLPMTYMAGILNLIIVPIAAEGQIILGPRFSVSETLSFWDLPIKYGVTTFFFIPTIINMLIKLDRGSQGVDFAQSSNIVACVGTAPLAPSSKQQFEKKYGVTLLESYGLSETLFLTSNTSSQSWSKGVGLALEGVQLSVEPDQEILASTPWNYLGYFGLSSAENKCNLPFKTGDLGEVDQNGRVEIIGRKKEIVIRGGVNIAPIRIDQALSEAEFFNEQCAIGDTDSILGEKIVCCYVRETELSVSDKRSINQLITSKLGPDYQIDEFVKVNKIPKNLNGKIDKLELKRLIKS